jgi:hypothetical protein
MQEEACMSTIHFEGGQALGVDEQLPFQDLIIASISEAEAWTEEAAWINGTCDGVQKSPPTGSVQVEVFSSAPEGQLAAAAFARVCTAERYNRNEYAQRYHLIVGTEADDLEQAVQSAFRAGRVVMRASFQWREDEGFWVTPRVHSRLQGLGV